MAKTKITAKTPAVHAPAHEDKAKRYFEAIGKRKTAVARVRFTPGGSGLVVNGKNAADYFTVKRHIRAVTDPLELVGAVSDFGVVAKVKGSGPNSQAEAVRHGIARALVLWNETLKKKLRRAGFITRDPRMVERKKYGLRKARRAPQWSKR